MASLIDFERPANDWNEALPKAWSEGSIRGFRIKGNKRVDMSWEKGSVSSYKEH